MKVIFDSSFNKAIKKIDDKRVLLAIERSIIQCENATLLKEISNLKKLKGYKTYFRIKIGSFRIGFEYVNNTINLITVLHRKYIYNRFP